MTKILAISGSLRSQSTNTAALRTAQAIATRPLVVEVYAGMDSLPHFNPDDDHDPLPSRVIALRTAVHSADALLISTPEYAGALPGSFKNLLDWTIGDDQPGSIYEKPVALLNVSAHGAHNAQASLRLVLEFAHARVVESACVDMPMTASQIGADGLIDDPTIRMQLRALLDELAG